MTNDDIDRLLDTPVPGGSRVRDWFLQHESEAGLSNVRQVVRLMFAESERTIARLTHERTCLAEGIFNASVKAGLVEPSTRGFTGPELLLMVDDMAECLLASAAITAAPCSESEPIGGEATGQGIANSARPFEDKRRFAVCENWNHTFSQFTGHACTRWVIDRVEDRLTCAQALHFEGAAEVWRELSPLQSSDLMASLRQNFDASNDGELASFGVELLHDLPSWARGDLARAGHGEEKWPSVAEVSFSEVLVEQVARNFLRGLLDEVGLLKLREVAQANQAEANPLICHSHDVCDANVVMAAAMEPVTGVDVDLRSQSQVSLWGAAWSQAKLTMPTYVADLISRPQAWYGVNSGWAVTRAFDTQEEVDAWNTELVDRLGRGVELICTGPAITSIDPRAYPNPRVAALAPHWDDPESLRESAFSLEGEALRMDMNSQVGRNTCFELTTAAEVVWQRLLEMELKLKLLLTQDDTQRMSGAERPR